MAVLNNPERFFFFDQIITQLSVYSIARERDALRLVHVLPKMIGKPKRSLQTNNKRRMSASLTIDSRQTRPSKSDFLFRNQTSQPLHLPSKLLLLLLLRLRLLLLRLLVLRQEENIRAGKLGCHPTSRSCVDTHQLKTCRDNETNFLSLSLFLILSCSLIYQSSKTLGCVFLDSSVDMDKFTS